MLNRAAKAIIWVLLIVLAVILSFVVLQRSSQHVIPAKTVKQLPIVTTATFSQRIIPLKVTVYGTTVSPKSVVVAAKASGVITHIYFAPGQKIKKGQLLFTLQLLDINNQLDKLKAQMQTSRDYYMRLVRVNASVEGSVSANAIQKAHSQYMQDLAAYNAAKSETFIKAPIAGTASDTNLAVGSSVTEGSVLLTITDQQSLQVKYALPSQYFNQLKLGQAVSFAPNDGTQTYHATVSYISPQLNLNDDNITLRADFLKAADLQPNVFGKVVQVLDPKHKALAVPQNFIQTDAQGFYVYVVVDGKVAKQYIQTGDITPQGYIEVLSGMTPQTHIITSDFSTLSPGKNVRVKPQ